jgi:3-oxoacyl-[acyl-carrier protein] reductase
MSSDKVWLVTGASRGIGLAVAERALAAGDRVAILARGAEITDIASRLGESCMACRADITRRDQIDEVVSRIMSQWGRIDVVINNAGAHRGGKIGRLSQEDWHTVIDTNLTGALNVITATSAALKENSAIVNIGAVVGFRGFPGDAAYAASKAGIAGLTRALAIELAPRGISVNLVIPGLVLTEMTEGLSEKALEAMRQKIPLGRFGEPDEIAEVVEWTARARYMTGAFVPADGGLMSSFGVLG